MLRLIPGTVFRMFGVRYSKIILQYPVALSLLVYSACSTSREQFRFVFQSCLKKIPLRTIYRYPCLYSSSQSFYFPGFFSSGNNLLSCLASKIIRPFPSHDIFKNYLLLSRPVFPFPGTIFYHFCRLSRPIPGTIFREQSSFPAL